MKIFIAELDKDQEGLVKEIRERGFDIDSVWDLVNNVKHPFLDNKFTGPYKEVYSILVDHLDKPHHPRVREGIIRALTEKDARDIAKDKLLDNFYKETDKNLIKVNYARRQVRNKVYGGQSSHLPLKLNMSGVIPPIFASSIVLLPATVVGWFSTGDSMR